MKETDDEKKRADGSTLRGCFQMRKKVLQKNEKKHERKKNQKLVGFKRARLMSFEEESFGVRSEH